jgi:transglutaminase-like putative cysteine protease
LGTQSKPNMKTTCVYALILTTAAFIVSAADPAAQQIVAPQFLKPAESRKFSVEYVGVISNVPPETKLLRVWLPVPSDSTVQKISGLKFSGTSQSARLATEPKYQNRIAYFEIPKPGNDITVSMSFTCERKEIKLDLDQLKADGSDAPSSYEVFRQPDKLVIIDDEIKSLSREVTSGKRSSLEKGRAIYDYVLGKMTYDKNHTGWGLGSTRHACDVGKGNCTDFHALFNSLARAQGIASGFEIGLYLPYERNSAEPVGGYHCWAFFRVPGKTWVPVDCSEGDRFPERKEYFFGNHTPNRVTLSTGRDITLEPKQAGPPLNYFLNPHAEADGKPMPATKTWSYKDL